MMIALPNPDKYARTHACTSCVVASDANGAMTQILHRNTVHAIGWKEWNGWIQ
jgi:hypothetical protein